ncbi:N-acetylmuramoyl-L-alanine amidase [Flavitalea flava]
MNVFATITGMTVLSIAGKLILASGLLFGYYWFFLRNRLFHRYNRVFLLLTAVVTIVIPFISIDLFIQPRTTTEVTLAKTLRVISLSGWGEADHNGQITQEKTPWLTLSTGTVFGYITGVVVCLFTFFQSLIYISRIRRKYPYTLIDKIRFYDTTEPGTPFSFFKLIFWNRSIPFDTPQGQQIFRHELYHAEQRHSSDILFMEFLCCIFWFNPFFHLLKKELKVVHEFLADEYAISYNNRLDYAELLVIHAIRQKNTGMSHPFSQHEVKRRIRMLTLPNPFRKAGGYFSRIMVLPLLLILFSAFAVKWTHPVASGGGPALSRSEQPVTVVIDAGHGGIDPGAQAGGGVVEKNIVLALAQKIYELGSAYNIQVILTRDRDELPGKATSIEEGLNKRVEIALEKKADLFISIHSNWGDGPVNPGGFEAYISKRRTDKQGEILAAALLYQLSSIYTPATVIRQRDVGIRVLDKAPCPAVLLECANMSLPDDLKFITNKDNQERVARKILEGIVQYEKNKM